jgi:hypothetical protein
MPFTPSQITAGSNRQLDYFLKNDPIDQVNTDRPFLDWLIKNMQAVPGGNQYVVEQIHFDNDSNFQEYFGSDQVTFNERDTVRQAKYPWFNFHDGFGLDEDTLAANGITVTDDKEAVASQAEKFQLTNLLKENYSSLKNGAQDKINLQLLQDGSQSSKACPGIDLLVSTTPTTGTVGGLDASQYTWWRNYAATGIAAANLIDDMHVARREVVRVGKMGAPDFYVAGSAFLDTYRQQAGVTINRQIMGGGNSKGGVTLDPTVTGVYFDGKPIVWDPTFDELDALLSPTIPFSKRCYGLNSKTLKLKPVTGHWMVNRKPERVPDRYVHYYGLTSKYRLTTNKRSSNFVLAIS